MEFFYYYFATAPNKSLHPTDMNHLQRLMPLTLLGLTAALATSCDSLPFADLFAKDSAPADQTAVSIPGAANSAPSRNVVCTTPNYLAKIEWQGDQPNLTFGRKPDQFTLNKAPVVANSNPDGSITYRASGEALTYARIYPNNSCFVQVVRAPNQVVLEENGTIGS